MSKTFLEVVNIVLQDYLSQSTVASVDENSLSRVVARYVNQVREQAEDAILWRVLRQKNVTATFVSADDLETADLGFNKRTRMWDVSGYLPIIYDVTDFTADNSLPKSRVWYAPIDMVRVFQQENATQRVDGPSRFALDINATADDVVLLRDIRANADNRLIELDLWVPQDDMDAQTQNTTIKVPTLPIEYGAAYFATQERGEELGIDGTELKEQWKMTLATAVAKEESELGGMTVEADFGLFDMVRRQY